MSKIERKILERVIVQHIKLERGRVVVSRWYSSLHDMNFYDVEWIRKGCRKPLTEFRGREFQDAMDLALRIVGEEIAEGFGGMML